MPQQLPNKLDLLETENQFLKHTISALREELERIGDDHQDECQIIRKKSEDEKTQLRSSINELREALESKSNEFIEEKQKIESSSSRAEKQYKLIISQLRIHRSG